MGKDSKIEWTHHTFNPWWGCVKVSPGCEHCYAETFSKRVGHNIWGPAKTTDRRLFGDKHWNEPVKWNALAKKAGERARVFCASMADVFEDHPQVVDARWRLFDLIVATPWLDWLLLTKRPENVNDMIEQATGFSESDMWFHAARNVWIGTSVENQATANERIPHLLKVPARVRFLSCEPLLGPIDLGRAIPCGYYCDPGPDGGGHYDHPFWSYGIVSPIHWVIAGGESGHHARPMHPTWARSLRDQCQSAGVAFHFKQWGQWQPTCPDPEKERFGIDTVYTFEKVGKHAAGRLLDGRECNEFPEVSHA